jgi:pyroglutamyl-peptidase
MKKTVLLTGFEPFNGAAINPRGKRCARWKGWSRRDFVVEMRQLPCVFGRQRGAASARRRTQARHRDRGRPGRRPGRDVDRAHRHQRRRRADRRQRTGSSRSTADRRPAVRRPTSRPCRSRPSWRRCAKRAAGGVSQTAGTFVCNHVFYGLMHQAARWGTTMRPASFTFPTCRSRRPGIDGAFASDEAGGHGAKVCASRSVPRSR